MSLPPAHRAAAALILRGEPAPRERIPSLLEALQSNKIHLRALETSPRPRVRRAWEEIREARPALEAREKESARSAELLESWRQVGGRMEEEGIPSTLFKSPRWFPARSSNLDVLVPPDRFQRAARILEEAGHIRFPHYREDHKLLYRTFRGGRPHLSVHLHAMVSWGKVMILEGGGVVGRSVPGEEAGFHVAAPQDAMAVTVAHTVFETDQIRLADLMILQEAAGNGASAGSLLEEAGEARWEAAAAAGLRLYQGVALAAGGPGLLDDEAAERVEVILGRHPWALRRVRGLLAAGVRGIPHGLPRRFSKEHLVRHLLSDGRRDPARRILDLASSAWSLLANRMRLRTRPASLIAVGGIDGSGKSSAAGAVVSALRLCEVPTARIWTRGGFTGPAAVAKALARRAAPAALPGAADEEAKREAMRSPWKRRIWIWGAVLEQALSLQRVRIHLALGRTVVADRYTLDTLADLAARLPQEPAGDFLIRPASLLLGAARAPDLRLMIQLPPEAAWRRKPDGGSLEARRALCAAYARVAAAAPCVAIDGTSPEEVVAQEAVDLSLRAVFQRFSSPAEEKRG